jgi:NAD(P)-dependent dehydrogenase (short-subunit alcohol dehydrogenase family)
MKDFAGKLAVVTGGGSGIGRELARALARAGAHVAMCDVFADHLADARAVCAAEARAGARISAHLCDVADEAQVIGFRDAALREHATDRVDLLFNNAGIGGGGSFVNDARAAWDRTFGVCWLGVYHSTRAFLPALLASREACIVNLSSINAVFAVSRSGPHTAYSAAKAAVKGFTEALLIDLRLNAPHVSVLLVMPGHIGTSIVANTLRSHGMKQPKDMTADELPALRLALHGRGIPHQGLTDEQVRELAQKQIDGFRETAPLGPAQAAEQILQAVRDGRWRLLIGDDARAIDRAAREHPDELYQPSFLERLIAELDRR